MYVCTYAVYGRACAGGTMRRDYYRGSQDNLAERAALYRGMSLDLYLTLFVLTLVYARGSARDVDMDVSYLYAKFQSNPLSRYSVKK